jgi:hypothetical protein
MVLPKSALNEWQESGVDPAIFALNVQTLSGDAPYAYLLYEINAASGRVHPDAQWRWARKHYSHIEHGGWWCSGLDPLNNWQPMYWGCFKPYQPRNSFDPNGKTKPVKYEHPPKPPPEPSSCKSQTTSGQKLQNATASPSTLKTQRT